MNQVIIDAISGTKVLAFQYKGQVRHVEPHTYGRLNNGHEALCAWQIAGGSGQDYRLFLISDISFASISPDAFGGPRPGYHRGDQRFSQIFAEL